MSIKFQCVECGCEIKVADSAAGKRGKCPQCSAVNDVPKPMDVSSDDDFLDFIMSEVAAAPATPEDDAPIPFDDDDAIGLSDGAPEIAPPPEPEPTPAPSPAPTPADSDDDDLLGLAPIDEEEERQREARVRKLMEQEAELLSDKEGAEQLQNREDIDAADLHHLIVNYCSDMTEGKLDRAKTHVDQLKKYRGLAGEAIDDFLGGKADAVDLQALAHIPPPVLAGFLKSLKGDLG